jgi:hypothetical protein
MTAKRQETHLSLQITPFLNDKTPFVFQALEKEDRPALPGSNPWKIGSSR